MHIRLGDLVKCRTIRDSSVGIVVKEHMPNQGLDSAHVRHIQSSYPHVYYVYFSDVGRVDGPYQASDITVQQSVGSC